MPEWCRWLNADSPAYLKPYSATGNNLFAYCENNPVNRADYSGAVWTKIKSWFSNTFGAGYTEVERDDDDPITVGVPHVFEIKNQTVETTTHYSVGNSSKPVSVYATHDLNNIWSFDAGIVINIGNFSLDVSIHSVDLFYTSTDENGTIIQNGIKVENADLHLYTSSSSKSGNCTKTNTTSAVIHGEIFLLLVGVTAVARSMNSLFQALSIGAKMFV